ncbi:MAG: TonB family protein [Chitinophagales bacterium]
MQISNDKWYATKMLSALLVIVLMMIFILNQSFSAKRALIIEPIEDPFIDEIELPISILSKRKPEEMVEQKSKIKPTIKIKVVETEPIKMEAKIDLPDNTADQPFVEKTTERLPFDSGESTASIPKMDIVIEDQSKPDPILTWSEQMPEYPGGEKALFQFLSQQVSYPSYEQEIGLEGMVVVSFVVGKDGSIEQIEVLKSPSSGFTKEAKSVIKRMAKWTPGMHNGKTVAVRYQLPIRFRIG